MTYTRMENCSSCGALIHWAITDAGKNMPVDGFPDAQRGNVSLYVEKGRMRAVVVPKQKAEAMRAGGHQLHLSHFATCPKAAAHRRRP